MTDHHRLLRAGFVLFLLVVPVTMGATPVMGQYRDVVTDQVSVESWSTSLFVPAVGERPDGSLVGVAMEVEATLRSGTGGVFLDTRPLTQLDMQGSARLAATMASSIAGADFQEYDFVIKVRSPTTAVGGPSAGGAMAVAFTALLLELPIRQDVMMTGMVNPDSSIGPVGGIIQKAEAVHNEGARTFLIPEGQGTVRHVEEVVVDGNFVQRASQVNVAEYADEKWGLRVVEVSDVHDAFRYFTDHNLERPVVPEATRSPVFNQIMGEAADKELMEVDERHARVQGDLEASGLETSDPQVHRELASILEEAGARLDRAHEAVDQGAPYTASSRGFQASVEISRVEVWISILSGDDPPGRLANEIDEASTRIADAVETAAGAPVDSVVVLEPVGAAQVRAAEAGRLVDRAKEALEDDRLAGAVEALAFARERERSVGWWLFMADELRKRVDPIEFQADLGQLAREYRQVAREARTYADVLGGQIGGGDAQARLLDLAQSSLRDSQQAQEDGLTAGALYLAVESQVASHAALSLLGSQALIQDRLDRQRDAALVAVEDARRFGLEPFLAASFREFAQALEPEDAVSALLLYGNAAIIATISAALAGGERPIFGAGGGPSEAPLVSRVGGLGPNPWTGYFALATIVFGFMAGILATLIIVQARTPPKRAQEPRMSEPRSRRGAAYPPGALHPATNGNNRHGARQAREIPQDTKVRHAARPLPVLALRRTRQQPQPRRPTPRGGLK